MTQGTEIYVVVNETAYYEGENILVTGWDSVWETEEKAKSRLYWIAKDVGYEEFDDESTTFYAAPEGPNVEYDEYRIDVWTVG